MSSVEVTPDDRAITPLSRPSIYPLTVAQKRRILKWSGNSVLGTKLRYKPYKNTHVDSWMAHIMLR